MGTNERTWTIVQRWAEDDIHCGACPQLDIAEGAYCLFYDRSVGPRGNPQRCLPCREGSPARNTRTIQEAEDAGEHRS